MSKRAMKAHYIQEGIQMLAWSLGMKLFAEDHCSGRYLANEENTLVAHALSTEVSDSEHS